jgi:hypothetical protein
MGIDNVMRAKATLVGNIYFWTDVSLAGRIPSIASCSSRRCMIHTYEHGGSIQIIQPWSGLAFSYMRSR